MPYTPGPTQGGVAYWQYVQANVSAQWNIYHGMNTSVSCEVFAYDDNNVLQKAFPMEVIEVDANNLQINWSVARKGLVTIVGQNNT